MIAFPVATRNTAFLAGASLATFISALQALEHFGGLPAGASEKEMFPVVMVFFFASFLFFIIGIKNLFPRELKTKFPLIYFPTDREGVLFVLRVWGRMLAWFLGAAAATLLLAIGQWVAK